MKKYFRLNSIISIILLISMLTSIPTYANKEVIIDDLESLGEDGYLNESGDMDANKEEEAENSGDYDNLEKRQGWIEIEGDKYYFIDEDTKATSFLHIDNNTYFFNSDGIMVTDWQKIDGDWYYFDDDGIMSVGWLKLNDKWYYLDETGKMIKDNYLIDNKDHIFLSSGKWYGNWERNSIGKWFKYDNKGYPQNKWEKLGSSWYYFNPAGYSVVGNYVINNKTNIFDEEGIWQGNWESNKTGWWYQYSNYDYPKSKWENISNRWYYFNNKGYMETGWIRLESRWYYLENSGSMVSGINDINNKIHIFSNSGIWQGNWEKNKIGWWYKYSNSSYPKSKWENIDSKWYYFNNKGYMETGWIKLGSNWYYLQGSGVMVTGWQRINSEWYYFSKDGVMKTGWEYINDKWYYFYSNGAMASSTIIGGYILGANGSMIEKKETSICGKTIMLDPGHGGEWPYGDPGATNSKYRIYEKDLNNELTKAIAYKLIELGANVIYTRSPDEEINPSLESRANKINEANPDLLLSIHHDSSTNKSASGISTHWSSYRPGIKLDGAYVLYGGKKYDVVREVKDYSNGISGVTYLDDGKEVTRSLSNIMVYDSKPSEEAIKSEKFATDLFNSLYSLGFSKSSYIRDHNLYITRWTNVPSVLLEAGFVSNDQEVLRVSDPIFRNKMADKIVDSIVKFFEY